MVDKKEVKHVAELARLQLSKEEEERFAGELSSILDYIEKLKRLNTKQVEPTSHPFEANNVMREDIAQGSSSVLVEKLRGLAPALKRGYVKVKTIF
jgi:aspartyl-tRNA(Asn)/glutamyl-tRNA(Gln) amidotransferase subunit C